RLATIGVMIVSVLLTLVITTISGAWTFIIEAGAGLGLVLILRWYWWRVNAWSEISAMIAPFIAFGYVKVFSNIQFPESLFIIVTFTTVTWLVTTFLTKPTDFEILKIFFERIHPGGFWKPIASRVPNVKQDTGLLSLAFDWFAGIALIYSMLFGIGKLILGEYVLAFTFLAIAVVALWFILWHITKMGWEKVAE
ncbi:MAG: sodium:proline symporter, partial [Bacteroidetes bacterium]|nr:sodium:proline symporter [Bacteroidota bacterium]